MQKYRENLKIIKNTEHLSYHDLGLKIGCSSYTVQRFCDGAILSKPIMNKILSYIGKYILEHKQELNQYERLVKQNRELQQENRLLKDVLKSIKQICEENQRYRIFMGGQYEPTKATKILLKILDKIKEVEL